MCLHSRSSLWTLWFSGVGERRSLKYARYAIYAPCRSNDVFFLISYPSVAAHRSIRGKSNSCVQTTWGITAANGSSSRGYRKLRAERKV